MDRAGHGVLCPVRQVGYHEGGEILAEGRHGWECLIAVMAAASDEERYAGHRAAAGGLTCAQEGQRL